MFLQGETSRGHCSPFLAHQNEGGGGELMLYPRGKRPYLVNVFVAGPVHIYLYISISVTVITCPTFTIHLELLMVLKDNAEPGP